MTSNCLAPPTLKRVWAVRQLLRCCLGSPSLLQLALCWWDSPCSKSSSALPVILQHPGRVQLVATHLAGQSLEA